MLAGNLASIGVGCIISVTTSYIWPENYDFEITRTHAGVRHLAGTEEVAAAEDLKHESKGALEAGKEEPVASAAASVVSCTSMLLFLFSLLPWLVLSSLIAVLLSTFADDANYDPAMLQKAYNLAVWTSIALFFVLVILVRLCPTLPSLRGPPLICSLILRRQIPIPLYLSSYIYSQSGFAVWIAVAFIWVIYGTAAVVLYPVVRRRCPSPHLP